MGYSPWGCEVLDTIQQQKQNSEGLEYGILCLWNFPGKNTGVGCHFPLQGVFPTQGLNHVSCTLVGGFLTTGVIWKPITVFRLWVN